MICINTYIYSLRVVPFIFTQSRQEKAIDGTGLAFLLLMLKLLFVSLVWIFHPLELLGSKYLFI